MDTSGTKDTYRREARRHRDFIDPGSEDGEAVVPLFFEHVKPAAGQIVAAYCAKGREFDPYPIVEALLAAGHVCALPVVQEGSRVLRFAAWREGEELVSGPFGILQPAADENTRWVVPDIVIVPLLAFDRRGYRLGYGGGYYDATLKSLRGEKPVTAVGVAYAQQAVLFNLPAEVHDERLDWVLTPKGVYGFGTNED